MKGFCRITIAALLVAFIFCIAVPSVKVMGTTEEITNYDLVILEDEELPAAKAPEATKPVWPIWVIVATILVILAVDYEVWYGTVISRVNVLNQGEMDDSEVSKRFSRLHPFRSLEAKKELEEKAAGKYFK